MASLWVVLFLALLPLCTGHNGSQGGGRARVTPTSVHDHYRAEGVKVGEPLLGMLDELARSGLSLVRLFSACSAHCMN